MDLKLLDGIATTLGGLGARKAADTLRRFVVRHRRATWLLGAFSDAARRNDTRTLMGLCMEWEAFNGPR